MSLKALDNSVSNGHSSAAKSRLSAVFYAWAQLVRLPNVFTAIADVLAGATLAGAISQRYFEQSWLVVVSLVFVVVMLYWTGMIWNDLNDIEQDRSQGRERPLVDHRISVAASKTVARGFVLLAFAALVVSVNSLPTSGKHNSGGADSSWSFFSALGPFFIASVLVICIGLYNSRLKLTLLGPVLMGLCRSCSLLLGISAGCLLGYASWDSLPHGWVAVIGHGLFVAGFTWAGRREAEQNESFSVALGWGLAMIGLVTLAFVPWFAPLDVPRRLSSFPGYPLAFLLMASPLIRRAYLSIVDPSPKTIQLAIKQSIFSIVFFDAILALQFGGPWPAIAICSLIIPSIVLGRYFSPT